MLTAVQTFPGANARSAPPRQRCKCCRMLLCSGVIGCQFVFTVARNLESTPTAVTSHMVGATVTLLRAICLFALE